MEREIEASCEYEPEVSSEINTCFSRYHFCYESKARMLYNVYLMFNFQRYEYVCWNSTSAAWVKKLRNVDNLKEGVTDQNCRKTKEINNSYDYFTFYISRDLKDKVTVVNSSSISSMSRSYIFHLTWFDILRQFCKASLAQIEAFLSENIRASFVMCISYHCKYSKPIIYIFPLQTHLIILLRLCEEEIIFS